MFSVRAYGMRNSPSQSEGPSPLRSNPMRLKCIARIAAAFAIGAAATVRALASPTTNPSAEPEAPQPIVAPSPSPQMQNIAEPSTRPAPSVLAPAAAGAAAAGGAPAAAGASGAAPAANSAEPFQPQQGAMTPSTLSKVVVTSNLDVARDQIAPSLGASTYTVGQEQINVIPQGENAPFQQVLLRMPSVVADSFGQEHVRGEHADLTYRVNGVLLPDPLNGFGQELDTHLINSVTLIDGTLPAQFGFRTAGIVDVTTKTGQSLQSNSVSIYGGGYDTFIPSFEVGGAQGKWDYFVTGSYKQSSQGIENPTSSVQPIHDNTEQTRGFAYLAYHIDDTSRISLLLNGSYANFQIPNVPNVPPAFNLNGVTEANSALIDENQNEQNYYGVVSYQKTDEKLSLQASAFSSYGLINYTPDVPNDLIIQGVAGAILNDYVTNGLQFDASYILNDQHTLRFGAIADYTAERLNTNTYVFPVDPITGSQSSDSPLYIVDDSSNHALSSGIYLQDEWKINKALTLNYGARYDRFDSNFDTEDQISPRVNLVWKADDLTTFHAGYARYFDPPGVQYVSPATIAKFVGTTNAPLNLFDNAPKVERSNYFDVGASRQITKPWFVNVDAYYKNATNLVDLGQFGNAVILSPFNYQYGKVYGGEVSTTYSKDQLSAFGNIAYVSAEGKNINSQQFLFDPTELLYIQNNYVRLDHESTWTASAGVSYNFTRNDLGYVDVLYGSGLRAGFSNTQKEPEYYPVNLGYQHVFHTGGSRDDQVAVRFDVINVFDQVYQLRNGTGIGVGAPQYGQRRTFYVGLAYSF
jgi:outer membrane receptor protein involved in Fe transport